MLFETIILDFEEMTDEEQLFFLVFAIFAWFMVVHLLDQTCIFMTCLLSYHWFQVRLGWHDAGTYDKNITEWPKCGGANGSLRFGVELVHAANKGSGASGPLSISWFLMHI